MDKRGAKNLLAQLAEHGVPPTKIATAGQSLPMFSAGFDEWVDRIGTTYLQELCQSDAHFKLVVAPYGGGKTHFLMMLALRALDERFAVSYLQCIPDKQGGPVRLDNPLGLYAEAIGKLQIKGYDGSGAAVLLNAVVDNKRREIEAAGAADLDSAFNLYLRNLKQVFNSGSYGDFAHVVKLALGGYWEGGQLAPAALAAEKWLEGRMDSLTREEWQLLGLKKVTTAQTGAQGRKLLLALAKFTRDAGCQGLALLIDEVETLFTAKGKALQAVLGAMRVMVDWAGSAQDDTPLFCAFAATPDVFAGIAKYPALQQRLAVAGATFDEGNDYSPQIGLDRIAVGHEAHLLEIGMNLVTVAQLVAGGKLDAAIQLGNAQRLARVASRQTLDIDARRLYVKTWASLLLFQIDHGTREFGDEELIRRYLGDFENIKVADQNGYEP